MNQSGKESMPAAFLMGLAIGAVAAALFSPKNGQEMRSAIKQKSQDVRESLLSKTENAIDTTQQGLDKAKNQASSRRKSSGNSSGNESGGPDQGGLPG